MHILFLQLASYIDIVAMHRLLNESDIRSYNIRTYQEAIAMEGSCNTISSVTSVFNTITRQAGYLLS